MKSLPEHACIESNELVEAIRRLKHGLQNAKRLPLNEIAAEVNALQTEAGSLEQQAVDMKTFVCAAFATHAPHETPDEVLPIMERQERRRTKNQPFELTA